VDDSPSVRRVLAALLGRAGWRASTARDGLEALELLQQPTGLPDLVLLDVEMPRMDGFELLRTLRGHPTLQALPVIMVTSRAGDKHRAKALEAGANAYVVKPYQEEHLLSLVRTHSASAAAAPAAVP
jgi:chemosensory pili system protein ChpA (sensor histidine kinase/response regulator)